MDDSQKKEFSIAIGAMLETFGSQATKPILHGYWLGLNDLTIEQLEFGVAKAIRQCKFIPKPAEIRDLAGCGIEDNDSLALRAWDEAIDAVSNGPYRHIDFEDKTINAVVRSLGGWPNFVSRFTDADSEKWTRLDFVKCYRSYIGRPVSEEATFPLAGLSQFESWSPDRKPVPVKIACRDSKRIEIELIAPRKNSILLRIAE